MCVSINKKLIGFKIGFGLLRLRGFVREGLEDFTYLGNNTVAGKVARQLRVAQASCTYFICSRLNITSYKWKIENNLIIMRWNVI
jgi:hypothetical protein